jgi:hypothetical protein
MTIDISTSPRMGRNPKSLTSSTAVASYGWELGRMPRLVDRSSEEDFRRGACSSSEAMRQAWPTSMICDLDLIGANAGIASAQSDTRAMNGRMWPVHGCSYPRERNSLPDGGFVLVCARLYLHQPTLDHSLPACSPSRVLMEVWRQSPSSTSVSGGRQYSDSRRSLCVMSRRIDFQSVLGSCRCMNRSSMSCPCCRSNCSEVSGWMPRWMIRAR